MRLCVINNIIMLLIIIVLGKISYNILRNKKNYETFTNSGWSLNHDGKLCYDSTCKDIAVLGSGDSGKICTITGNTLDCEKIEEGAEAEGVAVEGESVTVEGESDTVEDADDSENGNIGDNIVYSVDANGVKDGNLEFNNDTKELSATTNIVGYKLENIYNYTDESGIPLLNEGDYLGFFEKNGVIAIINTFSSDSIIKINSRVLDESYEIILDSQGKVTAIINTKVSD